MEGRENPPMLAYVLWGLLLALAVKILLSLKDIDIHGRVKLRLK